ncbi:DUF5123 domain-containing protein [Belliella marina]|uniref:DUF5123 domain-containing protein n=1 Tax=Belliella marina TaxID=1644146 RepID=A0ABW4VKB4_9BACT
MTNRIILFIAVCITLFSSCEDINQWEVDPTYDGLFRPLVFETVNINSTSVEIRYTKVLEAEKYIFEFSEDELEFSEIVKTVEVLADTLTPFAASTNQTRIEYRSLFEGLNGPTGYSLRMYAVNERSGLKSDYTQLYFETSEEQLFTGAVSYSNRIQISWTPTDMVSTLMVTIPLTGEEVLEKTLTPQEIAEGTALVEGLTPGTTYHFGIFNESVMRGRMNVRTSGFSDGIIMPVTPQDNLIALLEEAVMDGNSVITVVFSGQELYDLGNLSLPDGINRISFTGEPMPDDSKPHVYIQEFRISDMLYENIIFENLDIQSNSGRHFFFISHNGVEIGQILFKNSNISECTSLIRLGNNDIQIKKLNFDNCQIKNTGGWGVINIGGNNVKLDSMSFTNSTLTEMGTQLMDVRASVRDIFLGNCTFVNRSRAWSQMFRFDNNNLPLAVRTENLIIAGTNSGATVNALSFDMTQTALNVSFAGSYITTDMEINRYPFSEITTFQGTTSDLFVDAENGDFRIQPDSGFGGLGRVGDPRWFD